MYLFKNSMNLIMLIYNKLCKSEFFIIYENYCLDKTKCFSFSCHLEVHFLLIAPINIRTTAMLANGDMSVFLMLPDNGEVIVLQGLKTIQPRGTLSYPTEAPSPSVTKEANRNYLKSSAGKSRAL